MAGQRSHDSGRRARVAQWYFSFDASMVVAVGHEVRKLCGGFGAMHGFLYGQAFNVGVGEAPAAI